MKVYVLIFLLNKKLNEEKDKNLKNFQYVSRAYNNVILKIKESHNMYESITKKNIHELDITGHMKNKLCDLLKDKVDVSELNLLKKTQLREQLISIAGIGKAKAEELIKLGITDVNSLKQEKWQSYLNSGTLILLKYKPITKIPHDQIKKIEHKLTLFKKAKAKLVGSFLRHKPFSKDIDVMLISDSPDVLADYIEHLQKQFSKVIIYAQGNDKVSLIIQPETKKIIFFKIDVFRSPKKYQYAMLLYGTGSKKFNIKMRSAAKRHGFLLNQHGLFTLPVKQKQTPITVSSEKDIFKKINIPYIQPSKR